MAVGRGRLGRPAQGLLPRASLAGLGRGRAEGRALLYGAALVSGGRGGTGRKASASGVRGAAALRRPGPRSRRAQRASRVIRRFRAPGHGRPAPADLGFAAMVRHIFREYDIRGVADRDLTDETVQAIGRGLGQMLAPPGRAARIVVARDCRSSSPRLFDALVQGLVTAGCDVIDVGVGPTPLLYFAVHHLDTDGGVMITGSHNPAPDNGFKIMRGKASFFGPEIQRLRELVERNAPAPDARGSVQTVRVDDAYLDKLRRSVKIGRASCREGEWIAR